MARAARPLGTLIARATAAIACCALSAACSTDAPGTTAARPRWPRATRLAHPVDHPLGVAVDGDDLYFATGGFAKAQNAIHRVRTTGGPVQTLVQVEQLLSGALAVDAEHVYFTSEWNGLVLRVPKGGGAAVVVARAPNAIDLALDATHVYFVTFAKAEPRGTLQRVAKSGGAPEVLVSGHPGMDSLVLDESHAYFRSNKGLWRAPKRGGAAESVWPTTDDQNLVRLAGDATHLYFFLETDRRGRYAVARLRKGGGRPETIGPIANSTGRLAVSDRHVFFFREASLTEDLLARVSKAGGEAEEVAGSGHTTGHLAVAGSYVYFTDINSVYRVPQEPSARE